MVLIIRFVLVFSFKQYTLYVNYNLSAFKLIIDPLPKSIF